MRIVLALLTCFLFLNAETSFAIPAGPQVSSDVSATGTFAGVLTPSDNSNDSLGLFTFGVPSTGLGTGTFIMFSEGRVFTGTINAFGNTDTSSITGILQATYDYTLHTPVTTVTNTNGTTSTSVTYTDLSVTASVHGSMKATVADNTDPFSTTGDEILTGTADLSVDEGKVDSAGKVVITESLSFDVTGYQQSTTATSASTAG